MIDDALNTLLRTAAALQAVYPSNRVVDAVPRVIYTDIGGPRDYTDQGAVGVVATQYQLDVYAATLTEARQILKRIKRPANAAVEADRGIDGYRGTTQETRIDRISFPEMARSGPAEIAKPGANVKVARLIQTMRVDYRE